MQILTVGLYCICTALGVVVRHEMELCIYFKLIFCDSDDSTEENNYVAGTFQERKETLFVKMRKVYLPQTMNHMSKLMMKT